MWFGCRTQHFMGCCWWFFIYLLIFFLFLNRCVCVWCENTCVVYVSCTRINIDAVLCYFRSDSPPLNITITTLSAAIVHFASAHLLQSNSKHNAKWATEMCLFFCLLLLLMKKKNAYFGFVHSTIVLCGRFRPSASLCGMLTSLSLFIIPNFHLNSFP